MLGTHLTSVEMAMVDLISEIDGKVGLLHGLLGIWPKDVDVIPAAQVWECLWLFFGVSRWQQELLAQQGEAITSPSSRVSTMRSSLSAM